MFQSIGRGTGLAFSLFHLHHLGDNVFDGGRPVEAMRVPQIDVVHAHALQALLAGLADVGRIAAESESASICGHVSVAHNDAAELGREEDVGALAGFGEPFSDEAFGIPLVVI